MYGLYMLWIALLLLLFLESRKRRAAIKQQIRKKHSTKERERMQELAKQFIGKECLIYTITSSTVQGTLRDVGNGGLLVEGKDSTEVVNLDYVMRIREVPRNKKGKKKSVVLD